MFGLLLFSGFVFAAQNPILVEEEKPVRFYFSTENKTAVIGQAKEIKLTLSVSQKDAYIHPQAPLKVSIESSKLKFTKKEYGHKDAKVSGTVDKLRELVFSVVTTPEKSGNFVIGAKVDFYFCTSKLCIPKSEKTSMEFHAR